MPITGLEYIVGGAGTIATGAVGATIHWFAKQVVGTRDDVKDLKAELKSDIESIRQALYGDPKSKVPDGLIVGQSATMSAVSALDTRVSSLEARIGSVEGVCEAMHGNVIIRPQE